MANEHARSRRGSKLRDRVSTGIVEFISLLRLRKTIESDGKSWPWPRRRYARKVNRSLFGIRERLIREVAIQDGASRFVFKCENYEEFSWCMKMFIKEPGTCNWIKNEVRAGQIFYDIGANIGIYTFLAAQCVGGTGKVFAFEPHSENFARLLGNIVANNLQHVVIPCSVALHCKDSFFPFRYLSGEAGSSGSELEVSRTGSDIEPGAVVLELKYAVSIDNLIASGRFPPPHHMKIDVDGNELLILCGMTKLLRGDDRPRSVQVEINKGRKTDIVTFMKDHRYRLTETHHTRYGLELVARGERPDDHCYNAIFRPQDANSDSRAFVCCWRASSRSRSTCLPQSGCRKHPGRGHPAETASPLRLGEWCHAAADLTHPVEYPVSSLPFRDVEGIRMRVQRESPALRYRRRLNLDNLSYLGHNTLFICDDHVEAVWSASGVDPILERARRGRSARVSRIARVRRTVRLPGMVCAIDSFTLRVF